MTRAGRVFALAASCAVLGPSLGCSSTSSCDRDEDLEVVGDGIVRGNSYMSAPWTGPFAYFPPARTLRFLLHGPEVDGARSGSAPEPTDVHVNLAFSVNGSLAPSAGNQSIFLAVDRNKVDVKNDTCSDFYAQVTVQFPGAALESDDSSEGEAGASP